MSATPVVQIVPPHGAAPQPAAYRRAAPHVPRKQTSSSYALLLTTLTLASTAIAGFDLVLLASGLT
jgi:hypothetical protein